MSPRPSAVPRSKEQIAAARAELARLEDAERASSPALDQASSDWQSLTTITERLRGTLMAATQKVSLRATPELPPGGEDPDILDERARVAGAEDAALVTQVEEARSALTSATRAREAAEDADDSASRELARVNRVIADHREKVARLTGDTSTAASRLEAAIAEAEPCLGCVPPRLRSAPRPPRRRCPRRLWAPGTRPPLRSLIRGRSQRGSGPRARRGLCPPRRRARPRGRAAQR